MIKANVIIFVSFSIMLGLFALVVRFFAQYLKQVFNIDIYKILVNNIDFAIQA